MRDYDPTTGRYLQADPLGLVDGAPVYGYAGQSPARYTDPEGKCIQFGPLAPACAAAAGAAVNVAVGIILDFYIGDGCYTWEELTRNAAVGAASGPIGLYGRAGAAAAAAAARYADDAARAMGDLTQAETTAIQQVVNQAGRPLEVVGSAASGARKVGSDIDYVAPPSSLPYYKGLEARLPSIDPTHVIIPGVRDPNIGPVIRFEPN